MKILRVVLGLLLLLVLVALVFWLVQWQRWPWWLGAAILTGVLGIWFGILALRKYFLRRREKEFVRRVIEQDDAAIQASPLHEREQLKELQQHWSRSIELLRGSHLRKRGNPLYALPWYLVIGESGFGKTSAVKNALLESPLNDENRSASMSATRNCDWWFFENAIILDTAGRYTIPLEAGADKEEWEKFLGLLARYRRREPANGIIVAVTSDCLLQPESLKLREYGQSIRQRIDQVMRSLGARVPIYVLVTKMDLIPGMVEFCRHLPEGGTGQIMGFVNARLNPYCQEVLAEAWSAVSGQLQRLRRIILQLPGRPLPGALLFPLEFERLRPGLTQFIKASFEENPYQETPLLRGIFFSSARQPGTHASSEFIEVCRLAAQPEKAGPESSGLFLNDFFGNLLPKDRNLFTPLLEFLRWRRLIENLGLVSWGLLWICLCGLLTLSFFKNSNVIRNVGTDLYNPPALTDDMATNFRILEMLRLELETLRGANSNWWIPRFGLKQSSELEDRLMARYFEHFRSKCLTPIDERFAQRLRQTGPDTPDDLMAVYMAYLVTRITMIEQYLQDKPPAVLESFRQATTDFLRQEYPEVPAVISSNFADLYRANLYWSKGIAARAGIPASRAGSTLRWEREEKIKELRTLLADMLENRSKNLHWLVMKWIPGAGNIRLQDFWEGLEFEAENNSVISGAYTETGRRNIEAFLRMMEQAQGNTYNLENKRQEFWNWYQEQAYLSWYQFAGGFPSVSNQIASRQDWQRMASVMITDKNPYFRFLQRMADELNALGEPQSGSWVASAVELNRIRDLARELREKKSSSKTLLGSIQEQGKKAIASAREQIDPQSTRRLEKQMQAAEMWNLYTQSLGQLAPLITSRENGFNMVAQVFPDSSGLNTPAGGSAGGDQSAFRQAYGHFVQLSGLLQSDNDFPLLIDLIRGPFDFLLDYGVREASSVISDQWQEQVVGRLYGAEEDRIPEMLFGKSDGVVWKFLSGAARPFVALNRNGFVAREAFSRAIPFTDDFLSFLDSGQEGVVDYQPEYKVRLETLPLDVNDGAELKPFSNTVCLQCDDGRHCLENFNYPKSYLFQYSPDKCGDVSLKISLPDLDLKREFPGRLGMAHFLSEFGYGIHTYQTSDFPEAAERLKKRGVEWIKVSYKITGGAPVQRLLKHPPSHVPTEIVAEWIK